MTHYCNENRQFGESMSKGSLMVCEMMMIEGTRRQEITYKA
jgi:hypothetical protein